MTIIDIPFIVIILVLAGYCAKLKLQQPSFSSDDMSDRTAQEAVVSNNDVMQYIRDTTDCIKPLMDAKGIEFVIKCTPESMMGWIDTDKMDKILLLLLSDMIKGHKSGCKITFDVTTDKNYDKLIIRINDNGEMMLNMSIRMIYQMISFRHGRISHTYYEGQGNLVIIQLPIRKNLLMPSEEEQKNKTTPHFGEMPTAFHIPSNIQLNVPTIELPTGYDSDNHTMRTLVQQAYNSTDQQYLQRATRCIHEHLSDSEYSREDFARDMGSSVSTLYNKIHALTGSNVTNFVRDIRIKAACRLAKEHPDLRVSDIAYQVGFKDPKYFATSFKRVMGIQPKEYFAQLRIKS